jgi:trehalose-6-phosphatase
MQKTGRIKSAQKCRPHSERASTLVTQRQTGHADSIGRIDALLAAVSNARRALLMLDYDGTLAPFQMKRSQAFPYPHVVEMIQATLGSGQTRVVIISGRDAEEVASLLGSDPCPEIWGLHGSQRRMPDGHTETMEIPVDARRHPAGC